MASKKPLVVASGAVQQIAATDTIDPVALPTRVVGMMQVYTGTTGASVGYLDDYDGKWVYTTSDTIRTIGNASSGAAIAQAWTEVLFTHCWNQYSQTRCPVLTAAGGASTRGASAATDYAANKRITLPDERGRVFAGAGTGSSLTARTQHAQTGEETHVQTSAELVPHTHNTFYQVLGMNAALVNNVTAAGSTTPTSSTGGGAGFNVFQPTTFEHFVISAGAR